MSILHTSRSPKGNFEEETDARRSTLEALLAGSDVVSIHTPLTGDTTRLLDARAAMANLAARNVAAVLAGAQPITPIAR
ncbi:MAG: NAD(P)-dependent oxidoreductase [Gemmatimonadetes bacterium]|nr:NAD(P)-dependent oxidoreductase [Gemmatimonadota bacterium]